MQLKPLLLAIPVLLIAGAAKAEIKSVKVPSANFRESPSPDATIMFSADKFYPVEILKKHNGWARVKDFEGDEAWVAERLLGDQETVVITRDKVNIREKGSTSSDVIFKAQKGEVFKVVKRNGKWLHIEDANGEKGWIRNDMTWGEVDEDADDKSGKDDKKASKDDDKKAQKSDKSDKAEKAEKSDKAQKADAGEDDAEEENAKQAPDKGEGKSKSSDDDEDEDADDDKGKKDKSKDKDKGKKK